MARLDVNPGGKARVCCRTIVKCILAMLGIVIASRLGAAEAAVSFTKEIAPLFVAQCLACHNAEKAKGGYRLHTFEALLKAGSSKEPAIVPGQPGASHLFQLITAPNEDDRMPQKGEPLTPAQVSAIESWIEQGAPFDGSDRTMLLATLSPPRHPASPRVYRVPVPVTALAFDPSGEQIAAAGYHEITIWNSESGALVRRMGNIAQRTFDLAFSPDGQWLAAASGTPGKVGEVKLFDRTNGVLAKILTTLSDAALCLAFSPDGRTLVAGGADNAIRVWDLGGDKPPLVVEQHADWVLSIAFGPDGTRFVSGSRDKTARVFETATGALDETYTGHSDFVTAVAWINKESVASASRVGNGHRWSVKNTKKLAEFSGWENDVTRFVLAGTNLFSASLDGKLRQHGMEAKEAPRELGRHHDAIYSLAVHPASRRLASGSHDGEVRVWNMDDGRLLLKFIAAPGHAAKLSRSE